MEGREPGRAAAGGAGEGVSRIGDSKPPASPPGRKAFVHGAGFLRRRPPPPLFRAGAAGCSAGAGAAPLESGDGANPSWASAVPGRNRALCSRVKAPAVPELREEVSITQNKSSFFDLLSPAPAASFLAPKARWKYGVAVYLGSREQLFQDLHRHSSACEGNN